MSQHAELSQHGHAAPDETNFKVDHLKFGFWLFLASECVFFAALIIGFLAMHDQDPAGAVSAVSLFDLALTSLSTFVLLASSLAMVLAVHAIQFGDIRRMRLWLLATIVLGTGFLGFQAYEFYHFYHAGLTLASGISGSAFYVLTGFHGTHVLIGVIWLVSVLVWSFRPSFSPADALAVEVSGLYWHFVDVVWIVIFTVVYLLQKV